MEEADKKWEGKLKEVDTKWQNKFNSFFPIMGVTHTLTFGGGIGLGWYLKYLSLPPK